jgi:hypothetical protein
VCARARACVRDRVVWLCVTAWHILADPAECLARILCFDDRSAKRVRIVKQWPLYRIVLSQIRGFPRRLGGADPQQPGVFRRRLGFHV